MIIKFFMYAYTDMRLNIKVMKILKFWQILILPIVLILSVVSCTDEEKDSPVIKVEISVQGTGVEEAHIWGTYVDTCFTEGKILKEFRLPARGIRYEANCDSDSKTIYISISMDGKSLLEYSGFGNLDTGTLLYN